MLPGNFLRRQVVRGDSLRYFCLCRVAARRIVPLVFFVADVVAQQSSPLRCFLRSSIATRLPFVDCHILRVHIGSHGGHNHNRRDHRDRRDRRHIIIVVSTAMQPLSQLSCHSHTLFRRGRAVFVARVVLPTSIYRRCHHCCHGARCFSSCSASIAPVSLPLSSKR